MEKKLLLIKACDSIFKYNFARSHNGSAPVSGTEGSGSIPLRAVIMMIKYAISKYRNIQNWWTRDEGITRLDEKLKSEDSKIEVETVDFVKPLIESWKGKKVDLYV